MQCLAAMGDVAFAPPQSHHHHLPGRWNPFSTSITELTLLRRRNSTFPPATSDDLELLSIKPRSSRTTYTSLKDLLPSVAVNSPRPSPAHQAQSGSDICIRNRLVKQAAWAYLQPMSASTCSAGGNIFHRLLPRLTAFVASVRITVVRILNRMLQVIRIPATT